MLSIGNCLRAILVTTGLSVFLLGGCADKSVAIETEKSGVVRVDSESASLALRATHILLVRVDAADIGDWISQTNQTQKRAVKLHLQIEQVLKGKIIVSPDKIFRTSVEQIGRGVPRIFAVPGVWSDKPVNAGVRYIVFCQSLSTETQQVLQEISTLSVMPADESLNEVRWVIEVEKEGLSLVEMLPRLHERKKLLGPFFAEYLKTRLDEVLFGDVQGFDQLMSFLEAHGLTGRFRGLLLNAVYSRILLADPVSPGFVDRLVVGTFRVVAQPEDASLQDNLLQTYLPNLLGLEGGATKKSADEVFRAFPGEREKAEHVLANYHDSVAASRILEWIR